MPGFWEVALFFFLAFPIPWGEMLQLVGTRSPIIVFCCLPFYVVCQKCPPK